MGLFPKRWHTIAESRPPWEREALDYLRAQLPDQESIRVWSKLLPSSQVRSIGGQVVPIVTPGQMAVMPERWARESGASREGIS